MDRPSTALLRPPAPLPPATMPYGDPGHRPVKADASSGAIAAGVRLAAESGRPCPRALRSRMLDGMLVVEGAPAIGTTLGPLDAGAGLIPVMVTLVRR